MHRASEEDEEKRQFMLDSLTGKASLQEDLLEQLRQSEIPEDEWPIAEMIIA